MRTTYKSICIPKLSLSFVSDPLDPPLTTSVNVRRIRRMFFIPSLWKFIEDRSFVMRGFLSQRFTINSANFQAKGKSRGKEVVRTRGRRASATENHKFSFHSFGVLFICQTDFYCFSFKSFAFPRSKHSRKVIEVLVMFFKWKLMIRLQNL